MSDAVGEDKPDRAPLTRRLRIPLGLLPQVRRSTYAQSNIEVSPSGSSQLAAGKHRRVGCSAGTPSTVPPWCVDRNSHPNRRPGGDGSGFTPGMLSARFALPQIDGPADTPGMLAARLEKWQPRSKDTSFLVHVSVFQSVTGSAIEFDSAQARAELTSIDPSGEKAIGSTGRLWAFTVVISLTMGSFHNLTVPRKSPIHDRRTGNGD